MSVWLCFTLGLLVTGQPRVVPTRAAVLASPAFVNHALRVWGRPHKGLGRKGVKARVAARSLVVKRVFAFRLADKLLILVVQDPAAQPGAS